MPTMLDDKDKLLDKDATDKDSGVVIIEGEGEDDKDDRRLVQGDEGDDDKDGDSDERRKRNRESRRQRKARHRQLWDENRTLKTMNEGLQKALGEVNTRLNKIEQGSEEDYGHKIDRSLAGAERAMEQTKAELKRAIDAQDGDAIVRANEAMAQITVDRKEFEGMKARYEEKRAAATKTKDVDDADTRRGKGDADPQAVELQKTVLRNAGIFARRNSWYEHDSDDDDSETVRELDAEVARDGYNPATKDYWEELESRLKDKLPHRYKANGGKKNGKGDDDDEDDKDRTIITAGSGRGVRDKSNAYRLSKDRVDAIKEAGLWDDPKERAKMIESYKKYDAQHAKG